MSDEGRRQVDKDEIEQIEVVCARRETRWKVSVGRTAVNDKSAECTLSETK